MRCVVITAQGYAARSRPTESGGTREPRAALDPTTGPEVSGPSTKDCDRAMRTLLNIIWFLFGGLWLALGYALAGVIFCILIVTIPLGVASLPDGVLHPCGPSVGPWCRHREPAPAACCSTWGWIVLAGWWLALGHLTTAVAQALTIVGIPLAIANLKLIPVSLVPFGKEIVDARLVPAGQRPPTRSSEPRTAGRRAREGDFDGEGCGPGARVDTLEGRHILVVLPRATTMWSRSTGVPFVGSMGSTHRPQNSTQA